MKEEQDETIDAIAEEEGSELEKAAKEAKEEEKEVHAEHDYHDPITEEYKRDMQNWLGINTRSPKKTA